MKAKNGKAIVQKLWQWFQHPPLAVLLFGINLLLVLPALLPTLGEINSWDESAYIHNGQLLVDKGQWPVFAYSPLSSVFYGLTYLPFHDTYFWLVYSCRLGRILLFALLWWSTYLVMQPLRRFAAPWVICGLFLVAPFTFNFLSFPSDPLFTGFAALSLWQLLCFYNAAQSDGYERAGQKHLWAASAFMGVASLARNDGLFLFAILAILAIGLSWRRLPASPYRSLRGLLAGLLPAGLPFLVIVGGYVLFYGLRTGDFKLGTAQRTYDNFEAGQQSIYAGSGELNPVTEAKVEARRLFGTPQENDYSVFKAIRRNPRAYFQRLKIAVKGLPNRLLHAYGIRFAPLFLLLALRGILSLFRQRQYALLVILCLWPAHLASGFVITLFREGHLLFPFYVVLALSAIGLTAILTHPNRNERYTWLAILLGLALLGLGANKLAVLYGAGVAFLGLGAASWVQARLPAGSGLTVPMLILLGAGLIIHGDYPSPSIPKTGTDPREQGVIYLADHFPPYTPVAVGSCGPAWLAKMRCFNLESEDVPTDRSPEKFVDWMRVQGVGAIFVDPSLSSANPRLWELINPQIGVGLERVFSAGEGDVQVLVLKP
jgi:4-amino-4-deoxy-L-arabinose transferase-like glycosyltransferase